MKLFIERICWFLRLAKEQSRMKGRKANWIKHILYWTCLLRKIAEGKLEERKEVIGRRKRKYKQ